MDLRSVFVEDPEFLDLLPPLPSKIPHVSLRPGRDSTEVDRRAVARAHIAHVMKSLSDRGLGAQAHHVEHYLLDHLRRNCRPSTIQTNGIAVLSFLSYLKEIGRSPLEAVIREDIAAFIEHEQDRGLKPTSVSGRLRSIHAFLNFLVQRDCISPNVLKRKIRIKIPDSLPRAIDPEDIKKLLAVIRTTRDRALILVLLRSGMRIGELLSLTLEDLQLKEKRIEIYEAQKNRVGRVVYISDDAHRALSRWMECRKSKRYLFYGFGGGPLCYEAARALFRKYLIKAKLSDKGYTLHCLRHTYASELLNAGMRLECLQQLLGHSNIEMTRRYARLTDVTRKEEYFKAMAIIEKGGVNGHYRGDHQLP
jgi:integrase/recombinase XerD